MTQVLLIQLPLPQLNFGHQTGNIPFAAACLKQTAQSIKNVKIEILPQSFASYLGDAAILNQVDRRRPEIIGFTVYLWNVQRTLHLARRIKQIYSPRIIMGGPEVTPDNPLVHDSAIDFNVYGAGEAIFAELLQSSGPWSRRSGYGSEPQHFATWPSPYISVPLSPDLEGTMLLETMRGCPHRCAYCYYTKSRTGLVFKEDHIVLEGVAWARGRNIREVYFLDPSLNSRPGLKVLLKEIARLNSDHKLSLISEIRADFVDDELAGLLAAAGFKWLEIGLQSTNPVALKQMHRNTDLKRFVDGAQRLKRRRIDAAVDIIVGLPGDDPDGFDRTTRFVVDHDLHHDIQVFPLSLIPGTEFRQRHKELGLIYAPTPPYTVISTPDFSEGDMIEAFDLAEERFDIALYPLPDLDLAFQTALCTDPAYPKDITLGWADTELIYKVALRNDRPAEEYEALAQRVTHPYQLIVPPATPFGKVCTVLSIFTRHNPHTPLEIVFWAPRQLPDVQLMLASAGLARPHYLDNDLRLLYRKPGNRAILFTMVSGDQRKSFSGPMQRHIFWWRRPQLPDSKRIAQIEAGGFDGILIECGATPDQIERWQQEMAPAADEMILVDFARIDQHKQWLQRTCAGDYCLQVLP